VHQDVGAVGIAGSASYSAGTFSVSGAGVDIGGTSDQFHYVWQTMSGNGQIVARLVSVENTDTLAKGGVMIRESLAANARNVALVLTPGSRFQFQRRVTAGGATTISSGSKTLPTWIKLVRTGSTFTGYRSSNGVSWTLLGTSTVTMASDVTVGLVMSSHTNSGAGLAVLEGVAVTP
jgi:hypothetical protein